MSPRRRAWPRAAFRSGRPARSGRASSRSRSAPNARRSVSSLPTASGNSSASTSSAGGRRPRTRPVLPPLCERPRAPALLSQPLGHRAPRQRSELPQLSHAQPLELRVAVGAEGQERERQRREELLLGVVGHDQRLPGTRDARRRESGEPAPRSARAWIPGRADRGERTLERRLQASVQPLHALRLEVDATGLVRRDGEAGVLQPPQHPLPLPLYGGGILLDQRERRAHRECLPQPHARLDPGSGSRRGDGADERLGSGERARAPPARVGGGAAHGAPPANRTLG